MTIFLDFVFSETPCTTNCVQHVSSGRERQYNCPYRTESNMPRSEELQMSPARSQSESGTDSEMEEDHEGNTS